MSGKFLMMNMFGGRFVSELIKAGLIMEDQGQSRLNVIVYLCIVT